MGPQNVRITRFRGCEETRVGNPIWYSQCHSLHAFTVRQLKSKKYLKNFLQNFRVSSSHKRKAGNFPCHPVASAPVDRPLCRIVTFTIIMYSVHDHVTVTWQYCSIVVLHLSSIESFSCLLTYHSWKTLTEKQKKINWACLKTQLLITEGHRKTKSNVTGCIDARRWRECDWLRKAESKSTWQRNLGVTEKEPAFGQKTPKTFWELVFQPIAWPKYWQAEPPLKINTRRPKQLVCSAWCKTVQT